MTTRKEFIGAAVAAGFCGGGAIASLPSNFSHTPPQNVFTSAPRISGTTISPPGIRFAVASILMPAPHLPGRTSE